MDSIGTRRPSAIVTSVPESRQLSELELLPLALDDVPPGPDELPPPPELLPPPEEPPLPELSPEESPLPDGTDDSVSVSSLLIDDELGGPLEEPPESPPLPELSSVSIELGVSVSLEELELGLSLLL